MQLPQAVLKTLDSGVSFKIPWKKVLVLKAE